MPDFRQNILTGDCVIVAEDRASRPGAFAEPSAGSVEPAVVTDAADCPFCEGNELETPHETFAVRDAATEPDTPGWQVRFVPNRYPAVTSIDGIELQSTWPDPLAPDHLRPTMPAVGQHEVIIESPRHVRSLVELSADEIQVVAGSYRDRMRALAATGDIASMVLFKNSGAGAGASLAHIHSQLVGLPNTPPAIAQRVARCQKYFAQHGRSLYDDWLADEISQGDRVVTQTENLIALCPWASRFAAEMWIVPQSGPAHFEQLADEQLDAFATMLHDTLVRLETATAGGPYNFFLHNPPCTEPADTPSRWHLAILPRLAKPGGFEWSTGIHINPVSPERAAECLRSRRVLV
jgi:UDPglucose--hexose-1-phosphate uridylyltransferase